MSAEQTHETEPHADEVHEDPQSIRIHAYDHLWENIRFFSGFFALSILAVTCSNWALNLNPNGSFTVTLLLLAVRSVLILYFFETMLHKFKLARVTIFSTVFFLMCMIALCLFAIIDYPVGHS